MFLLADQRLSQHVAQITKGFESRVRGGNAKAFDLNRMIMDEARSLDADRRLLLEGLVWKAILGIAFHEVMERAIKVIQAEAIQAVDQCRTKQARPPELSEDLREKIREESDKVADLWCMNKGYRGDGELDSLLRELAIGSDDRARPGVIDSPPFRDAVAAVCAGRLVRAEFGFDFLENGEAWSRRCDLLYEERSGKLILVDYKTGLSYFPDQLREYRSAVEREFGRVPLDSWVVLAPTKLAFDKYPFQIYRERGWCGSVKFDEGGGADVVEPIHEFDWLNAC